MIRANRVLPEDERVQEREMEGGTDIRPDEVDSAGSFGGQTLPCGKTRLVTEREAKLCQVLFQVRDMGRGGPGGGGP